MRLWRNKPKPSPDEIQQAKQRLEESHKEKEASERDLLEARKEISALAVIREQNHIAIDIRKVLGGH